MDDDGVAAVDLRLTVLRRPLVLATSIAVLAMLAAFRRLKARAEHVAADDPLTGLFNRRSVYAALDQMIASSDGAATR